MRELLQGAWEFLLAGGPVMWPLVAASVWLWSLIILKGLWLRQLRREHLDLKQALAWLEGERGVPPRRGPRGRALADFLAHRRGSGAADLRLWQWAVWRQGPELGSHLAGILALAAVAPLLGLLGTVGGMIQTFQAIRLYGAGNAQALAAGISQALITTETGLLIAIPALAAGYYLRRQVKKEQEKLLSFQQAVERRLKEQGGKACWA